MDPHSEVAFEKQRADNYGLSEEEAEVVTQLLLSIGSAVCRRLDAIDDRLETVLINAKYVEDQLEEEMHSTQQDHAHHQTTASSTGDDSRPTMLVLNSEADVPGGSCLGDPDNPLKRVWVPISPRAMANISATCTHPTKMALTLIDYLFDCDTQAVSSLCGGGRYTKQKLDDLLVYAIRCHLEYIFDITASTWQEIRQSIDSKCHLAHQRKAHSLQLYPPSGMFQEDGDGGAVGMVPSKDSTFVENSTLLAITCLDSQSDDSCQQLELDGNQDERLMYQQLASPPVDGSTSSFPIVHLTSRQLAALTKSTEDCPIGE
jgi:hypothetical protein